jgi:hypothetical protein
MGYGYGFLLGLVNKPDYIDTDNIDRFASEIAEEYKKQQQKNDALPDIGIEEHGPSGSYSCGGLESKAEFVSSLTEFAKKFPNTVFALYHYYWDFTNISIYTFSCQGLLKTDSIDLECLKVGSYEVSASFDFESATCANNITIFFNDNYGHEFDWNWD